MKVLVAGDFCPRDRVAKLFEEGSFEPVLSEVSQLISCSDYSIVNFECPACDNDTNAIKKIGPCLRSTKKGVEAIKYAGFDCVTLANNHLLDYGTEGIEETLKTLNDQKVDYVGGGLNLKDASHILYKEISGKRLAVISCCEHEFSIATDKSAGCNPLNPVQQYYSIKEAKAKSDKVLMIVHGGHEHFQLPSPRMVETYRFFIDAGADAVVNHHQHCFSGYEIYNGKPIFYGVGNFCFDNPVKRSGMWTEGYMVTIDFSCDIPSFEIHPYKQCAEEPKVELLAKDKYNSTIRELNSIINKPELLREKTEKYYKECENTYSNVFEPIRNRWYLGAKRRGWLPSFVSIERKLLAYNYINCEAHRDKILFWLKNNS